MSVYVYGHADGFYLCEAPITDSLSMIGDMNAITCDQEMNVYV